MSSGVKNISEAVTPYAAASALGITPSRDSRGFYVPGPAGRLYLSASGFVSESPDCPFLAGGVLDFLSMHMSSYEKGARFLVENLVADPSVFSGLPPGYWIKRLDKEGQTARRLFEFAARITRGELASFSDIYTGMWLRKHHIASSHRRLAGFMRAGDLLRFLQSLDMKISTGPLSFEFAHCTAAVFPFYTDHHTVEGFEVIVPEKNITAWIPAGPGGSICWFGLPLVMPWEPRVKAYSSVRASLAMRSCYMAAGDTREPPHLAFRPGSSGRRDAVRFPEIWCMHDGRPLGEVFSLLPMCDSMTVFVSDLIAPDYQETGASAEEFAARLIVEAILKEKSVTENLRIFCQNIPASPKMQRMAEASLDSRYHDILSSLFRNLASRTYTVKKVDIREDSSCFQAVDAAGNVSPITNFTFDILHNLTFEGIPGVFHAGEVSAGMCRAPFCISSSDAAKYNVFERVLQDAAAAAGGQTVPFLIDSAYRSHLVTVMRIKAAAAPQCSGSSSLGISGRKFRFPGIVCDEASYTAENFIPHPHRQALRRFQKPAVRPRAAAGTDADLLSAAEYITGGIWLSMLGHKVEPLVIEDSRKAREKLAVLCRATGQQGLISAEEMSPSFMEALPGYPVCAVASGESRVRAGASPVLLLSQSASGMRMVQPAIRDAGKAAGDILFLLLEAAGWILRNFETIPGGLSPGDSPRAAGREILSRMGRKPSPANLMSMMPSLVDLFLDVPAENLASHIRKSETPGRVLLYFSRAVPAPVFKEIRMFDRTARRLEKRKVECAPEAVFPVLKEIYSGDEEMIDSIAAQFSHSPGGGSGIKTE